MAFFQPINRERAYEGPMPGVDGEVVDVSIRINIRRAEELGLSEAPLRVLGQLAAKRTNRREIGQDLDMSPRTVTSHFTTLRRHFGETALDEIAKLGLEEGYLNMRQLY